MKLGRPALKSKLDPHEDEIHGMVDNDPPTISEDIGMAQG